MKQTLHTLKTNSEDTVLEVLTNEVNDSVVLQVIKNNKCVEVINTERQKLIEILDK